ncbi:MAG: DUF429 domain-containing protein [Dehalococcoidia bacterium]
MPLIAGVDLAWTSHHDSGLCLVELNGAGEVRLIELAATRVLPEALAETLAGQRDLVAAIDAPLIIGPNRTAERELGRRFGKYKASAHSANEALLVGSGRDAGPRLARGLVARGVSLDPTLITPQAAGRFAFESYPHAQHVVLFRLDQRIPYKRKKGRDTAFIREQLRVFQAHLGRALGAEWPALAGLDAVQRVLAPGAPEARGTALKALEDQLDALTCVLAAYLAWRDGLTAADVLGGPGTGYVAIPGLRSDPRFAATSAPAPSFP